MHFCVTRISENACLEERARTRENMEILGIDETFLK